jgi:hypothetical protein
MVQVVEHLPSKHNALSSTSSTAKKKERLSYCLKYSNFLKKKKNLKILPFRERACFADAHSWQNFPFKGEFVSWWVSESRTP